MWQGGVSANVCGTDPDCKAFLCVCTYACNDVICITSGSDDAMNNYFTYKGVAMASYIHHISTS